MWPIVSTTLAESRHELVLSGANVTELLSKYGFDERIYELVKLNFLEISQTNLDSLSEKLANLRGLTQLCLTSNRLTQVPESLGQLHALKFLDLSFNQLGELPCSIFSCLENLTSINLSGNSLESIPSVSKLQALQELLASKNILKNLPDGIHSLPGLALLDFSHNKLSILPDTLHNLGNLKTADFSDNILQCLPNSLHRCKKLHLLKLQNNPLRDGRLRKLANDPKATKPLLEYLRRLDESHGKGKKGAIKSNSTPQELELPSKTDVTGDTTDSGITQSTCEIVPTDISVPHIVIQRPEENELYRVSQASSVKDGPRPYLVMCTIHGVVFKSEAQLKAFTRAQEEWHRDIGQLRRRATLATHDLNAVRFPLQYVMRQSDEIQFHVLNTNEPTTGDKFLARLYRDAEADRKTRKQAKFSQLYRYLSVLNLDTTEARDGFRCHMLPVLEDAHKKVISVPPLSNCHETRLTMQTTNILIEVTGIQLNVCKEFAETVIAWLLEHTVPPPTTDSRIVPVFLSPISVPPESRTVESKETRDLVIPPNALVVRPVRVVDSESAAKLSSLFPSRLDLVAAKFGTVR